MKTRSLPSRLAAGFVASLLLAGPACAQEPEAAPFLGLELNALQPSDTGCKISFVVSNHLGGTLELATTELALFDIEGAIAKIIRLDFKSLIADKSKVLQFNVADLDCEGLGRILVNDITTCAGEGIEAEACLAGLKTSAVPPVQFGI